jgi:hypothetical protein
MELKGLPLVWVDGHNGFFRTVKFTVTHGLSKSTGETIDAVEVLLTPEEAIDFGLMLIEQATCLFREQADDDDFLE